MQATLQWARSFNSLIRASKKSNAIVGNSHNLPMGEHKYGISKINNEKLYQANQLPQKRH